MSISLGMLCLEGIEAFEGESVFNISVYSYDVIMCLTTESYCCLCVWMSPNSMSF